MDLSHQLDELTLENQGESLTLGGRIRSCMEQLSDPKTRTMSLYNDYLAMVEELRSQLSDQGILDTVDLFDELAAFTAKVDGWILAAGRQNDLQQKTAA
jgi:hypothetical protein